MYVQDSLESKAEVFLDPNKLSEDGTIALVGRSFSEDGQLFAYSLSHKGSDWVTIKVIMSCFVLIIDGLGRKHCSLVQDQN